MSATVLVTGNTYNVRDGLKALGGRWDAANKGWAVPASRAEEARALVAGQTAAPKAAPAPTGETVLVTGNTYPVRDALVALGGRWDGTAKGWRVPAAKADAARALVAGAGPKAPARPTGASRRPGWRPCGYPGCNPSYCDECDGEGLKLSYRNRW